MTIQQELQLLHEAIIELPRISLLYGYGDYKGFIKALHKSLMVVKIPFKEFLTYHKSWMKNKLINNFEYNTKTDFGEYLEFFIDTHLKVGYYKAYMELTKNHLPRKNINLGLLSTPGVIK